VNFTASGNVTVNGILSVAGAYQILGSPPSSGALPVSGVGFTNFGVDVNHCIALSPNATGPYEILALASTAQAGQPIIFVSGSCPLATSSGTWVDIGAAYGNTDLGVALTACKTQHLTDGVNCDGSSFGSQGTAIKWSGSGAVAGYTGKVQLPAGTINLQNTMLLQAKTDVYGKGEDATTLLACAAGNANCNSNFIPTGGVVVGWTDDFVGTDFNNGPTFDTRLFNVTINGASISQVTDLANCVAQENESGPHFVTMYGWANGGIGYNYGCANRVVTPAVTTQLNSISTSTACTTCALALPGADVAGNTIIACAEWKTTTTLVPTLSSISDANGNPYTLIAGTLQSDGTAPNQFSFQCGYSQNINVAASNIIHFNMSAITGTFIAMQAVEYSHLSGVGSTAALDQAAVLVANTTNPTGTSITPTKNGELVIGVAAAEAAQSTYAAGGSFTSRIGTSLMGFEDFTQPTAGALAPSFTSGNTHHAFVASLSFFAGTNNGAGSQNHSVGPVDIYVKGGASPDTSTASAVGLLGSTGVIGEAGPKVIYNCTLTVNNGFSGTAPLILMEILDGTATSIDHCHFEGVTGANSYALALGGGAGIKGFDLSNINGGNLGTATALVFISNASNSSSISFTNINAVGPGYPTDLLLDPLTGCTDPTSSETSLSIYDIGGIGSIVGGFSRFSSSITPSCQSQFYELQYQIDDPTLCHIYSSGGGGAENCTNSSLINPTPAEELIFTAFPPSTTSITLTDNGIGPHTAGFIQIVTGSIVNALLGTTCTPKSTFTPTYDPYMTGSVPYVPGVTLGTMTFTMGSSYVSGPVCVEIRLTGYDQ